MRIDDEPIAIWQVEMLERAQDAYGQKEEGVLRFQRCNTWKEEMSPDEL